jgi:hypothetical protein
MKNAFETQSASTCTHLQVKGCAGSALESEATSKDAFSMMWYVLLACCKGVTRMYVHDVPRESRSLALAFSKPRSLAPVLLVMLDRGDASIARTMQ